MCSNFFIKKTPNFQNPKGNENDLRNVSKYSRLRPIDSGQKES